MAAKKTSKAVTKKPKTASKKPRTASKKPRTASKKPQKVKAGARIAKSQEYFVEFAVDNAEKALAFYERVFDWATRSAGEYHIMGPVGEEAVVGIFPTSFAPHTLIYFQTERYDELLERVRKHGGHIIADHPQEGVGLVAQFSDPQGVTLAARASPTSMPQHFITIEPDKVSRRLPNPSSQVKSGKSVRAVYVEFAVKNAPAAVDFYKNVFDWGFASVKGRETPFHLAGKVGAPAMAGITPTALGPAALAYFGTDNIPERAERIQKCGGRVIRLGKMGGIGGIGHFKDPFGNPFGLVDFARGAQKMRRKK